MSEPPGGDARPRPPYGGVRGPSAAAHGRGRRAAGRRHRRRSPPGSTWRRWGSLPGRTGVLIVTVGAVLGGLVTALTGSAPGLALGVFVIGGTAAAVLAVRPRAVYLVIPVPALCYMAAATVAGLIEINARGIGASSTTLAVSAAQWMASGFPAMIAATVLAVAAAAARWPFRRPAPRGPRYPPPTAGAVRPRHRSRRDPDHPAAAGSRAVPRPRAGADAPAAWIDARRSWSGARRDDDRRSG
jgi:hypothetical protein